MYEILIQILICCVMVSMMSVSNPNIIISYQSNGCLPTYAGLKGVCHEIFDL